MPQSNETPFYHFWSPKSGALGGALMSFVIAGVLVIGFSAYTFLGGSV